MARPGDYYERGPSPWVPATILGVILLIATTPFSLIPDASQFGYLASAFPSALIWIPLLVLLATLFFGGNSKSYGYGRRGMRTAPYAGGLAGGYGDSMYPPDRGEYNNSYYGGYNNNYYDQGLISSFTDYGGLWMLILLGIWLLSMFGARSPPAATTAMTSSRFGFPWSLFSPRPQYVIPLM